MECAAFGCRVRTYLFQQDAEVETSTETMILEDKMREAIARGECPSGWPVYRPDEYPHQLEAKKKILLEVFPECSKNVPLELFPSPREHHRNAFCLTDNMSML